MRQRADQHGFLARAGVATLCAVVATALSGCATPLFPRDRPRSQYESYDTVRNQSAPRYVYDEFGRATPNLRGRLGSN